MTLQQCEQYPAGTKFQVTKGNLAFKEGELLLAVHNSDTSDKCVLSLTDYAVICLQPLRSEYEEVEVVLLPDHAKVTL